MHVRFNIHCDSCGQRLSAVSDTTYKHDNDDDCDTGNVTLPRVTVDDLRAILHGPTVDDLNKEAQSILADVDGHTKPTKRKTATKKKGKK